MTTVISGAGAGAKGILMFGGFDAVGGVMSLTVIVCVTFVELPQSSVTLYVRVIISGQVFPSELSEINEIVGIVVQLSAASVTTEMSATGISSTHSTFTPAKFEAVGGVMSLTVIVCVTIISLPQSSATLYVRVIISGQVFPSELSETNEIVGIDVQLSAASVTTERSANGTSSTHSTLIPSGFDADGGVVSSTVIT